MAFFCHRRPSLDVALPLVYPAVIVLRDWSAAQTRRRDNISCYGMQLCLPGAEIHLKMNTKKKNQNKSSILWEPRSGFNFTHSFSPKLNKSWCISLNPVFYDLLKSVFAQWILDKRKILTFFFLQGLLVLWGCTYSQDSLIFPNSNRQHSLFCIKVT